MADRDLPAEVDYRKDRRVTWKVFAGIAGILAALTIAYLPSEEAAGIVMLAVATLLAVVCGVFLWRAAARIDEGPGEEEETGVEFLPTSSPWPFGIGLGATLVLNGLLIGTWFLVPGVALLGVSIAGFARQSRHRFDR
ncbi:MAG: cytochrome c oxidase subunit 4 [Acidimicrobiales bacterium]|nr:cytochrome c oxidase subunit 4 [Acidimicrobiales bacterium]